MSLEGKMLFFFAASSFPAWFLLFAAIGTRRDVRRRVERERARTTGVIVEYTRRDVRTGRSGSVTYWRPVVEFTADGQPVRGQYDGSMDRNRFPVGAEVEVVYDISDPAHFHLDADPVYQSPGRGAFRVSIIWIALSAVLAVALAVFVGGWRPDFSEWSYRFERLFRR